MLSLSRRSTARLAGAAGASAAALACLLPASAATLPAPPAAATQAGAWLTGELNADGTLPGPFSPDDVGLTIDGLFALQASGSAAATTDAVWSGVAANAAEFAGPPSWAPSPDYLIGGASAKVLVAAETTGHDPTAVRVDTGSTYDFLHRTLDLLATSGPEPGRLTNSAVVGSDTNMFDQSLAVIGLSMASALTPGERATLQQAVDFLVTQQCAPGWFQLYDNDQASCSSTSGATADNDATSMALQALVTARDAGLTVPPGALSRAAAYLVSVQLPDGSFGGSQYTPGANSNSTGLAALALSMTGEDAAAARAGSWVSTLQVPSSATGALKGEVGAIAYDPESMSVARSAGIEDTMRDTWRRATSQAVFALNPVPFAKLAEVPAATTPPPPPKSSTSTTAPPTSPSTTSPATTGSSATRSAGGTASPSTTGSARHGGSVAPPTTSSTTTPRPVTPSPVTTSATATGSVPASPSTVGPSPSGTPAPISVAALPAASAAGAGGLGGGAKLALAGLAGVALGAVALLRPRLSRTRP